MPQTATRMRAWVWETALDALALDLSHTVALLAPEAIVIGGGLSQAGPALFEPLAERLDAILTFHRRPAAAAGEHRRGRGRDRRRAAGPRPASRRGSSTRVILTVTPNPALDVTYRVRALEPGESHRVDAPVVRAGGKGINVARVIAQTGGHALALATAGGVDRDPARRRPPRQRTPPRARPRRGRDAHAASRSSTRPRRTPTMLNEAGASADRRRSGSTCGEAADRLSIPAQCLVGSGSLPADAPEGFFASLVAIARDRGIPSIVDTTGPGLVLAARAGANVLKPNRRELAETTGESDPLDGAAQLHRPRRRPRLRLARREGDAGAQRIRPVAPAPCPARHPAPRQRDRCGRRRRRRDRDAAWSQGERDPSAILVPRRRLVGRRRARAARRRTRPGFAELERTLVVTPA